MTGMHVDLALVALAFLLGVLMSRTTVCTVACLQQWIHRGRPAGLLRIATLVSGATVALLGAALLFPVRVTLPGEMPLSGSLVLGALLLGAGSVVNGACYLGSVVYLGRGNASFVATLAGLASGWFVVSHALEPGAPTLAAPAVSAAMAGPAAVAGLAAALVVLATSLVLHRRARPGAGFRAPSLAAALAAGFTAGLIYARHPDWNYGSVLVAVVEAHERPVEWAMQAAALALLAGAVLGAVHAHRFHFEPPALRSLLRRLAGGALMGAGATLIPGGHDLLLLWSIPGLTLHGVVAYTIVAATVAALLAVGRRWSDRSARA